MAVVGRCHLCVACISLKKISAEPLVTPSISNDFLFAMPFYLLCIFK